MKRIPDSVMRIANVDPLYASIDWDNFLANPPDHVSIIPDMARTQQLKVHAELVCSLVENETEILDDAPQLWAQFQTKAIHWRVFYKGQATNHVERIKAGLCFALATHHMNTMAKCAPDTFGKGTHIASLKKATQALVTATSLCPPINEAEHMTPIEQARGLAVCTILLELVFFKVLALPPLQVTQENLLKAAGMLRNIAELANTIIAAEPVPQKPFISWARTVHCWASHTAAFVWGHYLYTTITEKTDCRETAERLAEVHMLLDMYSTYAKKNLRDVSEDPLDEHVCGQFQCGYKNEIRSGWEPTYSKQLESGTFSFIPERPTIVQQTLSEPVSFEKLFELE